MIDVLTPHEMKKYDAKTQLYATPARELMQRAADALAFYLPHTDTAIICGKDNNGGDGYALAKTLLNRGENVTVYYTALPATEDAKYYHGECINSGIEVKHFTPETSLKGFKAVADCIYGIGLRGIPDGLEAKAIQAINASGAYIVSADVPSGLDALSGHAELCVSANTTVTFGYAKPGLFLGGGKDHAGALAVADIGIKADAVNIRLAQDGDFADILRKRKNDSHKGTYGTVAMFGGCIEYSGALKLADASCAAMRAGCGICRVVTDAKTASSVAPHLMESTLFILEDGAENEELERALYSVKAAAVGMGWGSGSDKTKILEKLLKSNIPLVIDADGLNALSAAPQLTALLGKNTILTPHPAEFARLCCTNTAQILADPIGSAVSYAKEHSGCCVLLKGASTVVTDGTDTYICSCGCPGMATAGSGDVLSGVILGLLGWNGASAKTALCGTYIAGLAGELAQEKSNSISMIASDTVKEIPQAVSYMIKQQEND